MNGSNHWKCQLAKVNQRLINGQGTEVLVIASPVILQKMEDHRQLFHPYSGASVWRTDVDVRVDN